MAVRLRAGGGDLSGSDPPPARAGAAVQQGQPPLAPCSGRAVPWLAVAVDHVGSGESEPCSPSPLSSAGRASSLELSQSTVGGGAGSDRACWPAGAADSESDGGGCEDGGCLRTLASTSESWVAPAADSDAAARESGPRGPRPTRAAIIPY